MSFWILKILIQTSDFKNFIGNNKGRIPYHSATSIENLMFLIRFSDFGLFLITMRLRVLAIANKFAQEKKKEFIFMH